MAPSVALASLWAILLVGDAPLAAAAKPGKPGRVPMTALSHSCSRVLSRTVRQRYNSHAIRQLKGVDRTNISLAWPAACPLNPLVDLFGWHEKNKSRTKPGPRNSEWVCNYTGKVFKSEHYIDLYMETHYSNVMPENGTCLAEFCEVFGFCNVKEPGFFESLASEAPPCDPNLIAAQKAMCHSVNDRCAAPGAHLWPTVNVTKLNVDLHKTLCEQLTCEARAEKHFSSRKWSIIVGGGISFACIAVLFYCACVASKQDDRENYYNNRRYRNAGRRVPFDIKQGGGKPLKQE